jgi:serine/threonine protein phosphatase PrpC
MKNQTVVDFVKDHYSKRKSEKDFKVSEIAAAMFDKNIATDTFGGPAQAHTGKEGAGCDNMTAVVVFFNHPLVKDKKTTKDE